MANTDKFRLVGKPGTATTLSAPGHTSGGTSITVGSTTNWPTTTGVTFAIDRVTVSGSTETQVPGSYTIWVGDVTGATTIANMVLDADSPNSDQNYSAGLTTRVYIPVSVATHNDMINGILVHADQDGTLKAGAVDEYSVLATVVKRYTSAEYAPQGYMQNGKIVTSVATNDLTVAIKTLAGNDPSASDPVLVRIGNTVRTITSALSHTLVDGTNWFNSGAAEHATQDIDYFTYLGWNTSAGAVVIGFARIPHGRLYSDFSTTSTNDKYCAINNITGIASGDEFEVVGRFNASLTATATFQWSIPATSIIINRPVFQTRYMQFVPQWTSLTIGNATYTARYKVSSEGLTLRIRIVAGTTTSASGGSVPLFNLPISSTSTGYGATMPIGTMVLRGALVGFGYLRWATSSTADIASFTISGTTVIDAGLHEALGNTDTLMITANDIEL
jgi:hypothetical protein